MATTYLRAESALANPLNIFATFDRATLAKTVEVLVCVLDAMDPDPDLEPNGDELDGANEDDEDDDPDTGVDDVACDEPAMDLEPEGGF